MNGWQVAGATIALALGGAAQAQDTLYWPAPVASMRAAQMKEFPIGTPLTLATRTEVNTKQAKPGDRVYLDVAESLTFRGQIVIPAGAPVVAEVVHSEPNGHFGKRGSIKLRLLYAQTPSGPVRLTGDLSDFGKNATMWSVGGAVLVAWPMVFIHGTSGYIRQGTPVTAHLAEPLVFAEQPMQAQSAASVRPDDAKPLPARFEPAGTGGTVPLELSRR